MFSLTKKLSLGLVIGIMLSAVPAQEVLATGPVEYFKSLTTTQKVLLVSAAVSIPYLVHFFTRKPLPASRFDSQKLVSGSILEKIQQINYFILDDVFGWPRKENKIKVIDDKDETGKYKLEVGIGQEPYGFLGVTSDYIESAAKSLALPKKLLGSIAIIVASLKYCSNLGDNIKTSITF